MTQAEERKLFAANQAPAIAKQIGITGKASNLGPVSSRFVYFADDTRLLLVAGEHEEGHAQVALSIGISLAAHLGKSLTLCLPKRLHRPTLLRSPWLKDSARPELWVHDEAAVASQTRQLTREHAIQEMQRKAAKGDVQKDFTESSTALHLGDSVVSVTDWATTDPRLDPGHRKGERSWHFRGQRVLSLRRAAKNVHIRAGIHYSSEEKAPLMVEVSPANPLGAGGLAEVQRYVEAAIVERLKSRDSKISRPDEHWLQAVIRRDPELIGIEQPALREFPAWRPADNPKGFSRGFIDLLGLDGQGKIRIAEAKLAANNDPMFVLQGLDYYIWAQVYRAALGARLGAAKAAPVEIHYVIGLQPGAGAGLLSKAAPVAEALGDDIPWAVHLLTDWYDRDRASDSARGRKIGSQSFPMRQMPAPQEITS